VDCCEEAVVSDVTEVKKLQNGDKAAMNKLLPAVVML
jgi:hypothetical protein